MNLSGSPPRSKSASEKAERQRRIAIRKRREAEVRNCKKRKNGPSRTRVSWRGAAKRPWLKNCDELLNRSVLRDACRRRRPEDRPRTEGRSAASRRGCILLLLRLYVSREKTTTPHEPGPSVRARHEKELRQTDRAIEAMRGTSRQLFNNIGSTTAARRPTTRRILRAISELVLALLFESDRYSPTRQLGATSAPRPPTYHLPTKNRERSRTAG